MTTDLTPEERERIYQEEKARRETVDRVASEREAQQRAANLRSRQVRYDRERKRFKIAGIVVASFFALLVFLAIVSPKKDRPRTASESPSGSTESPVAQREPEPEPTPFLAPGVDARVIGGSVIVAPTEDALKQAERSVRAGDILGVTDAGAIVVNEGTHVLVLDESGDFYRVRVMGGTMPGTAGWVRKSQIGRF